MGFCLTYKTFAHHPGGQQPIRTWHVGQRSRSIHTCLFARSLWLRDSFFWSPSRAYRKIAYHTNALALCILRINIRYVGNSPTYVHILKNKPYTEDFRGRILQEETNCNAASTSLTDTFGKWPPQRRTPKAGKTLERLCQRWCRTQTRAPTEAAHCETNVFDHRVSFTQYCSKLAYFFRTFSFHACAERFFFVVLSITFFSKSALGRVTELLE